MMSSSLDYPLVLVKKKLENLPISKTPNRKKKKKNPLIFGKENIPQSLLIDIEKSL